MVYKIYIGKDTWFHPKNEEGLNLFIKHGYLEKTNNIDESDIILYISPSPKFSGSINEINIYDTKYKNKVIIIGPHFSVFPTDYIKSIDNSINNNIKFNLLSEWVVNFWKILMNNNLPLVQMPYPVDTELFKPDETIYIKKDIIIYIKNRSIYDYQYIIDYIKNNYNEYNIHIFNYKITYEQNDYISSLKNAKFCIWIGCPESQGFAVLEALSMNVPLLVFNVYTMGQIEGLENDQIYCNIKATTIPYWDEKCGEKFYKKEDFEKSLKILLSKIDAGYYTPRKFILDNLNVHNAFNNYWKPIIENCKL